MADKDQFAKDIFGDSSFSNRKKTVNSRAKGARGERMACEWFKLWTGQEFNRTPGSGGLGWKNKQLVSGDIVAPVNFKFPFSVEIKNYKDLTIDTTLRTNSIVYKFYKQCVRDAEGVKKHPLLLLRRNNMKSKNFYVVFSFSIGNILYLKYNIEPISTGEHSIYGKVIIYNSGDILDKVLYKDFVKLIPAIK